MRVEMPDGAWADMAPITGEEWLSLIDSPESETYSAYAARSLRMLEKSATAWSWQPASFLSMPRNWLLLKFMPRWTSAVEDDAVPPANGASSPSRSPAPDRAKRRSASRAGSPSST